MRRFEPQQFQEKQFKKLSGLSERALGHDLLLFAALVGLAAGLASIGFYWVLDYSVRVFLIARPAGLTFFGVILTVLTPAFGGLLCGILLKYSPDAKGGVPEVIDAFMSRDGLIRRRVWIFKTLASSVCIGSGGSAGREGPVVQIGASVGSTLGRVFKVARHQSRLLTATGAAAGVAAVFNAPVGGAFFAAEIVMGEFEMRDMTLLFTASAMGSAVSRVFLHNRAEFQVPAYSPDSIWELAAPVVVGALAALLGQLFITTLHKSEHYFEHLRLRPIWKPALGGLLVGLIGLLIPEVFGTGSDFLQKTFVEPSPVKWLLLFLVAKLVATSLTLGSGGSGGDLMPSLFLGSTIGGTLGHTIHHFFPNATMPPGAYAVVGAAALFGGVAHAPVTAIILGFEMAGNYGLILPLMIACSVSALISKKMRSGSLYTLKLNARGVDIDRLRRQRRDPLDSVRVMEVMDRDFLWVPPAMTLASLIERFSKSGRHGFVVLDEGEDVEKRRLLGIVTLWDVEAFQAERGAFQLNTTVADVMQKRIIVCYPEDTLGQAWERLGDREVGRLPVVDADRPEKLLGLLHRSDFLRAYRMGLGRSET